METLQFLDYIIHTSLEQVSEGIYLDKLDRMAYTKNKNNILKTKHMSCRTNQCNSQSLPRPVFTSPCIPFVITHFQLQHNKNLHTLSVTLSQ